MYFLTDLDLGWIAGIIDGEGSIVLEKKGTYRHPRLVVSSTDKEILLRLQTLLGGNIIRKKSKPNCKEDWIWRLYSTEKVLSVLKQLQYHLLCPKKKRRATFLVETYPSLTNRNGFYTDLQKKAKQDFEKKFYQL